MVAAPLSCVLHHRFCEARRVGAPSSTARSRRRGEEMTATVRWRRMPSRRGPQVQQCPIRAQTGESAGISIQSAPWYPRARSRHLHRGERTIAPRNGTVSRAGSGAPDDHERPRPRADSRSAALVRSPPHVSWCARGRRRSRALSLASPRKREASDSTATSSTNETRTWRTAHAEAAGAAENAGWSTRSMP